MKTYTLRPVTFNDLKLHVDLFLKVQCGQFQLIEPITEEKCLCCREN